MKIEREVWRLALVIALGAVMSQVDTSVVNVGLERIGRDLRADLAGVQWVANAYLIALAAALPACGWLVRRAGAGRVWLWSLAGFTVASGLCAAAPSLGWLVAFRVLQGVFAGLLLPAGQTVLGQAVGPERLGRVMATLGVAVTLGPTLGLVLGGVIVELASWPWLFAVNLPLGALAIGLGVAFVPRGEPADAGRLEWRGLLLVSAGVPLVVYGATVWAEGGNAALPLAAGAVTLVAFIVRGGGILDLGLYRVRAYRAASGVTATVGAAMFGAGQLLPLYFQLGRGEDVLSTGILLVSMSLGTAAVLPFSGRLVDRFGSGAVAAVGALATLVTTLPFAFVGLDSGDAVLQALLLVRGMALALLAVPATTGAYKAVTRAQLPDATAQVNIVLRVGGALGGALVAVILATRLPSGPEAAFHTAFAWLSAASVLGVAAALWLLLAERSARAAQEPALRAAKRRALIR
jgi:EmrB/QacA subfamily drug resistance transporter